MTTETQETRRRHPLATKEGVHTLIGILCLMGAVCPKCGFGTRVSSKRWARCRRENCDGMARRRTDAEVTAIMSADDTFSG